jgi:hypothetical protein
MLRSFIDNRKERGSGARSYKPSLIQAHVERSNSHEMLYSNMHNTISVKIEQRHRVPFRNNVVYSILSSDRVRFSYRALLQQIFLVVLPHSSVGGHVR